MTSRLAVIAVLAAIGCTSSNSLSAMQACTDFAHASCTSRDTCSDNFSNTRDYGTESVCESRVEASCVTGLTAPGTAATPESREQCAEAFGSGTETCLDTFEDNPSDACEAPAGSGATGAACGVAAQCASAYCAIASTAVCGTCQPLPSAGASCTVNADCGRDLACAIPGTATTGTCAAWVAQAGACLTGVNPCQPGLACVGDAPATSTQGMCEPTVAIVNNSCDSARKLAPPCDGDIGLACLPTTAGSTAGTCQAIAFVDAGATCGAIGGPPATSFADCSGGGLCVKAATTDRTGTCMAPAADGGACDDTNGPPCLSPAKCVAGTCTLPDPTTCH
jgi:hypothetical protein